MLFLVSSLLLPFSHASFFSWLLIAHSLESRLRFLSHSAPGLSKKSERDSVLGHLCQLLHVASCMSAEGKFGLGIHFHKQFLHPFQ